MDLSRVGLYTKQEAMKICDRGDCYISMDKLGITEEMLNFKNPNVEMKIKKIDDICEYINRFVRLMKNKQIMKYGE